MALWQSPVYRTCLENRRLRNGTVSSNLTGAANKESWMSGLNRHPAKVLFKEIWAVGSNPTLSANSFCLYSLMVEHPAYNRLNDSATGV
jgi:hypothetical protein